MVLDGLPKVTGYRSVTAFSRLSPHACAHAHGALTGQSGNQVVTGNRPIPPRSVTILKLCRCIDCRKFSEIAGEYFCSEYIGGTKARWADGCRECDPPPDAWHYCAGYDGLSRATSSGPQISRDVWPWPNVLPLVRDVGPCSSRLREGDKDARKPTKRDWGERGQI